VALGLEELKEARRSLDDAQNNVKKRRDNMEALREDLDAFGRSQLCVGSEACRALRRRNQNINSFVYLVSLQ
jgi:FtsZ-binding cell division protein ZapB